LSVGLDPMVAAMNNIYTIDGYHAIYPLSYKKKFRKIIKKQLEKDLIFKDGSSFIENIETILNHNSPNISGQFALTNNSRVVRSELKRINYWSKK